MAYGGPVVPVPGEIPASRAAADRHNRVRWLLPVLAVLLRPMSPLAADPAPQPASGETSAAEHRDVVTWQWSWDRGIRYDIEFPFEDYWVGPDHEPIFGLPIEKRLAFVGRIGGIAQVDVAAFDESEGLQGNTSTIELRRLRFGTRGDFFLLGYVSYSVDLELVNTDLQVGDIYLWWGRVPWIRSFRIGNFTPPLSLESVTSARDTVFMENGLPVQAFAPGRSAGIQIGGPQLSDRLTWALGGFRTLETPTVGDQSQDGGRFVGRLTGLPEVDPTGRRLTHLGISGSLLFAAEDVRYRSRPESHLAPTFVDTGAVRSSKNSGVVGLELAQIAGPWMLMSETLLATVKDQSTAVLWGGYVSLSRFLSDDIQPYDRNAGKLARFETPHPFSWSAREFGTLRAAARLSYLDLNDANVEGGRETNVTADLTWYLNHYLALRLEYGFAAIRGRPDHGDLHFVQTRFQFDFF